MIAAPDAPAAPVATHHRCTRRTFRTFSTPPRGTATPRYTPFRVLPGPDVGKYKILAPLGSGGFGSVFLAEDTWLDKKVALKVPHRQQNLDFTELLHEPRLLGSMSHPNIVTVLTAEKQEGVFFIVMEYVAGETLETIIMREGALELTRALDFSVQIANAVDHAHSNNVIHRDLRPGNVLVSEQGLVKVADFGTSRVLEIAAHGTTVIGSPPYMAPEQFHGKAVFASDLYSLGVTMYQMLTGILPYETPSPAELQKLMTGELVSPPRLRNPEDPEGRQRHRPEGDGTGDRLAVPARLGPPGRHPGPRPRELGPAPGQSDRPPEPASAAAGSAADARHPQPASRPRNATGPVLLALPQAAPRALRPLPVLRRSAVDAIIFRERGVLL